MSRHGLIAVLVLLGAAATASAQVRLEGRVRSADGAPIAGAVVRLRGMDLTPQSATTDPAGQYVFQNVRGTWVTLVVWAGGRPVAETSTLVSRPVEVVNLTARPSDASPTSATDLNPFEGAAGGVGGLVRSADGLPLVGARVTIVGTGVATTTDSFGRYDFGRLRAGISLDLRVSATGFVEGENTVQVPEDERTVTDFALEAAPAAARRQELAVVEASADGRAVAFKPDMVSGLAGPPAGTVTRALQLLPGVHGSLENPSEFIVRGGSADQTVMTYEGMTIYPFSGLRGLFGGFDTAAVERVEFSEAALAASQAGAAGAINLSGSGSYPRPTGYLDASAFGVGGRVAVPIGTRGSVLVTGRRNPFDKLYQNVINKFSAGQGLLVPGRDPRWSGGTLAPAPKTGFHDVTATVQLRPSSFDRVSVSYYDARDAANLSRNVTVPAQTDLAVPAPERLPAESVAEVSDVYDWTATGASATWRRQWSPRVVSSVVFGRTEFEKTRADASVLLNAATGEDYSFFAGRGGSDARSERNRIRHSSLRMSSDVTVGQQHALTIGAEVAQLDASYTALVEKPVAGSTTRSALVSSGDQDGSGRLVRVFVEDLWRPIPRLVLTLGTRLVSFDLDSGLRVEPVASAAYAWRPGVQFLGGWSVTHQAAMRVTRENRLKGDTDFWALANGASIPMARTEQWSAGARVDRTGVLLEASLYYKRLEDLTMFATAHASPVAAVLPEPTLHNGSGRAAGVNLLLQSQTSRNDLWVGYSGGRTVYTYPTLGAGTFLASFVRQHEFKIGDTLRVKGPWSVGATWVAASGLPTTSVSREAVWLATAERTYRTIFGSKNASVLPTYRRLDLSSEIVLRVGATNATFGATVFNVFNLQNPRYRTHEIFGATRETSDMLFVGRAFNAFARFGF